MLDHHRPIHLKNCYSKYNVVVFGSEMDVDDIPSDGSEMSFNESDNSSVQSNENGSANSEDDSEAGVSARVTGFLVSTLIIGRLRGLG